MYLGHLFQCSWRTNAPTWCTVYLSYRSAWICPHAVIDKPLCACCQYIDIIHCLACTAKILYRKLGKNIPRKETVRLQSQFLNSYICERFIHIFPRSVCLFCCRKIGGPIVEIYKSLTQIWMCKLGLRPRIVSFLGVNVQKSDFICSVHSFDVSVPQKREHAFPSES